MKRIICIVMVILIALSSCKTNIRYSSGRDTVKSYGDGTFQIGGRNPPGIFYAGEGSPLISHVDRYYESSDMVYILGHEEDREENIIYGIIDTKSNVIQVYFTEDIYLADRLLESPSIIFLKEFNEFTDNAQEIFNKMAEGAIGKTIKKK